MRAVIFSDIHLESGGHLGSVDADYENTRLRDAEAVLDEIVATPHDAMLCLGDIGRTAAPRPVAYRILQRALAKTQAPTVLVMGNHDWTGSREHTGLHVVADGLPNAVVVTKPMVVQAGPLQVGVIPWTPPTRLFDAARHDPRAMHHEVAKRLVGAAHLLGKKVDPERPSILVLHWLLGGGALASGSSVIEANEPIVPVDELEVGPWDAIVAGHNHVMQHLGERSWHTGPPLRTGFGESEHPTGFLLAEWLAMDEMCTVTHVPTNDRRLVRLTADDLTVDWMPGAAVDVDGAIVRITLKVDEAQANVLNANGQAAIRLLKAKLTEMGAVKIVGPQMDVQRERRARSDLAVDTDPSKALDAWLDTQEIAGDLREQVLTAAKETME